MSVKEIIYEKVKKIGQLKDELAKTDYQAIKYAEGEMTLAEYQPVKDKRKAYRTEINALQAEIKALRG